MWFNFETLINKIVCFLEFKKNKYFFKKVTLKQKFKKKLKYYLKKKVG